MSKELTTIDYTNKDVLKTLKDTVARGATDADLALFLEHCKGTGLNPFKKEVWFIKGKGYQKKNGEEVEGQLQIMTGINGFYAIANSHAEFDGIEIVESDTFKTISSVTVAGWNDEIKTVKLDPAVQVPEFVEARVWRKDRKFPSTAKAKWSEYGKDVVSAKGKRTIWGTMPSIMLAKCAESLALRKAFPQELNGLYTQEEMPSDFEKPILAEVLPGVKPADELPPGFRAKPSKKKEALPFENDNADFIAPVEPPKPGDWVEPEGVIFQYDLSKYPFKSPKHKDMLIGKLKAERGAQEIFDDVFQTTQYVEGLQNYLVNNSEAA